MPLPPAKRSCRNGVSHVPRKAVDPVMKAMNQVGQAVASISDSDAMHILNFHISILQDRCPPSHIVFPKRDNGEDQ